MALRRRQCQTVTCARANSGGRRAFAAEAAAGGGERRTNHLIGCLLRGRRCAAAAATPQGQVGWPPRRASVHGGGRRRTTTRFSVVTEGGGAERRPPRLNVKWGGRRVVQESTAVAAGDQLHASLSLLRGALRSGGHRASMSSAAAAASCQSPRWRLLPTNNNLGCRRPGRTPAAAATARQGAVRQLSRGTRV